MPRLPANYSHNKQLSTTVSDIVPEVTSDAAELNPAKFHNGNTTTNRVVTVHIVEVEGDADAGNILVVKSIPPLKTWTCYELAGEKILNGMKAQAKQGVGTDVNVNLSGFDITS